MGPGLLESVYEICFCHELSKRAIPFHPQVSLPVRYDNILLQAAVRLDILVEDLVICELKSVELLTPLFQSQLLTYLLTGKRLGFLINFNVASIRDGIKRVIL
jgi:GxxExxY protein